MRILIPTSSDGDNLEACRTAAELTRAVDGTLMLATAVAPGQAGQPETAQRKLDAIRTALADMRVDLRSEVLVGEHDEAICDYVAAHHVDLVILHDERQRDALLMQSIGCPVMILGTDCGGMRGALAGSHRLSVLVAVDRCESSDAPIAWLKRLRSRIACDVTLLYAYWPTTEHSRLGIPLPGPLLHADPRVVSILERELEHRVGTLSGDGRLTIRCRPAIAMVDEVVDRAAHSASADMVVVGSHHRHGWDRFSHPSISEALATNAQLPVVCIQHDLFMSDARPPIRKVLVATDLTAAGNHAIDAALDLVRDNVATIGVVHVRSHGTPNVSDAELSERLRGLVPAAQDAITTQVFVIDHGPVAAAIVQKAAQWNADAICLGARTPGIVARVIRDSVAGDVVKRAECPVLVARGRPQ